MCTKCGASPAHFVGICKKMPIMAHRGTYLAHQTCPVGHVMPHPPLYIWVHPHDQSQTTALLTHILQSGTKLI